MPPVLPSQYGVPAWVLFLLVTVVVLLVVGTLIHEGIHILTAVVLGATIHTITLTPRASRWRYVLGDVRVEFEASPRVSRVVAIAPTVTAAVAFATAVFVVESVIVLGLVVAFLAVIGAPSRHDLTVLAHA